MLIGIVGLNGSGKDTVALYLVKHYGFVHRDLGHEIRQELKRLKKNHLDRDEMIAIANEMRQKFGFDYWCRKAIGPSESDNLVITSLRNPSEVSLIKSHHGMVVEVFADQGTRFTRTEKRVRNDPSAHGNIKSLEEFVEVQSRELDSPDPAKQQLFRCISMADHRLDNSGSLEQLHKEIDELLATLKRHAPAIL